MINVAIIGAGRIGKVHGESIATKVPDAKITAVADPFMNDSIREWAGKYGITKCVKD